MFFPLFHKVPLNICQEKHKLSQKGHFQENTSKKSRWNKLYEPRLHFLLWLAILSDFIVYQPCQSYIKSLGKSREWYCQKVEIKTWCCLRSISNLEKKKSWMCSIKNLFNPLLHNIEKQSNILSKSYSVNIAKFSKYVWSFCSILHEMVLLIEENSHVLANILFNWRKQPCTDFDVRYSWSLN